MFNKEKANNTRILAKEILRMDTLYQDADSGASFDYDGVNSLLKKARQLMDDSLQIEYSKASPEKVTGHDSGYITPEREAELSENFWEETNDPETEEWRDELTADEKKLVEQWDDEFEKGYEKAWRNISATQEKCKPSMADRLASAKATVAERGTQPQVCTKNRSVGHDR